MAVAEARLHERAGSYKPVGKMKDVIHRVPRLGPKAANVEQAIRDKLIEHQQYITAHGEDLPEIRNWQWGATK